MTEPNEEQTREDLLKELNRLGYTEEELERDNPYNQWMYEDE